MYSYPIVTIPMLYVYDMAKCEHSSAQFTYQFYQIKTEKKSFVEDEYFQVPI